MSNARGVLSTRDQITDRLREDVFSGRLLPGERVSEATLAERFGVSRGPIREALSLLTSEGLFVANGLGVERIGILKAVYPAVWGIFQVATGPLSDRWGRKGLIVAGMWVQAAALVLTARVGQAWRDMHSWKRALCSTSWMMRTMVRTASRG